MNYRFFVLVALVMLEAGCSKGVAVTEPLGVTINFYNCTVDPVTLQVGINDELQIPFLNSGSSWSKFVLLSQDSLSVRLRAEALPQRDVISAVSYRPAAGKKKLHYFTIYQSKAGEKPYLVLPDTSGGVPQKGGARLQFTYRTDLLPDSLKLKFYNSKDTSPTDSCIVTRRSFSGWLALQLSGDYMFEYEIWDVKASKILLERSTFPVRRPDMALDYNICFIDKDGFGNISTKRLY